MFMFVAPFCVGNEQIRLEKLGDYPAERHIIVADLYRMGGWGRRSDGNG
jgi:hypothetical protein